MDLSALPFSLPTLPICANVRYSFLLPVQTSEEEYPLQGSHHTPLYCQRRLPFALPMCLPYPVPGFVSSPIRSSETGEVAASNELYVLGTS